ncbi:MAG: imidazolonepropionase [Thermoplasmata archaeon]
MVTRPRRSADLLIVNASELVTLAGPARPRRGREMEELGIIKDGALAIRGGRVVAAGPTSEVRACFCQRRGRPLDASGKTVIPGLVDPHTHPVFAGSREGDLIMKLEGRSYLDILKAGGGIMSTVRATRAATEGELLDALLQRLDRALLHGTTTIEAKSGYGLDVPTELRLLRVLRAAGRRHPITIVPTFMGAHALPPEFSGRPHEYIDHLIREALPEIARHRLAEYCDVFCEEGVFTVEQSRRLLLAAKRLGLWPRIHADELARTGGAELAAELGAASADHLLRSSQEGLKEMAEAGVVGVLLPATVLSLMSREYPDARGMVSLGIPLALATDLNPNCMTESMPFVIALSCYCMRMKPSEALTASTINAAYAIGRGAELGSLEPGKRADAVILDAPNYIHIAYHFGVNIVDTVLKGGRVVIRGGRPVWKRRSRGP